MKMNDKGTSLVEVTCGFLLLVVAMTAFIKIIRLSSELTSAAVTTKNSNMEFEDTYYSGVTKKVKVNGTTRSAFREDAKVYDNTGNELKITITEWTPDESTGYFNEWYLGNDGVFVKDEASVTNKMELSRVRLNKIENMYDYSLARTSVFWYERKSE